MNIALKYYILVDFQLTNWSENRFLCYSYGLEVAEKNFRRKIKDSDITMVLGVIHLTHWVFWCVNFKFKHNNQLHDCCYSEDDADTGDVGTPADHMPDKQVEQESVLQDKLSNMELENTLLRGEVKLLNTELAKANKKMKEIQECEWIEQAILYTIPCKSLVLVQSLCVVQVR